MPRKTAAPKDLSMYVTCGQHLGTRAEDHPCNRNIEMTPLCKVDVTLPGVRGALGVRGAGGVDEQEGIRPAWGLAGHSVWPSGCRGRLRVARSEAAPGVSVAGRFERGWCGQLGL